MPPIDFEELKDQCNQDLYDLQTEFRKIYNIDSYEHWFFEHAKRAFHFQSDDGRNLYFDYVDIGSFSTKTNSWLWSWENDSTPPHVTKGLDKVRAFGKQHGYDSLTEGYLEDADEYTGWGFTAVAARLLNAIGSYRVPSDHLYIFFIFTNELTQEEYDARDFKIIECYTHGSRRPAFICQHLNKKTHTGFHEAFDSDPQTEPADDDDEYQAWCDKCEKVRAEEDGWNERSMKFARIKLVCDRCYFEIKQRNIQ